MYQGRLEATGTITLDDFWPVRESDADTVKVTLGEFSFAKKAGGPQKRTHAFEGAGLWHEIPSVREYFEPVVKTLKQGPHAGETRFTVRLQGVDAPELHYPGIVRRGNYQHRQHGGEAATLALRGLLAKVRKAQVPCTFYSLVDEPGQVVDKYGRFVGYVEVGVGGKVINLNHWLVENGWAFPTFYDSCNATEIQDLLAASKKARKAKLGIWQEVAKEVRSFHGTPYRDPDADPKPKSDEGPVVLPKLFRRQCTMLYEAGLLATKRPDYDRKEFASYLDNQCQTDTFVDTEEFLGWLKGGKEPAKRPWSEVVNSEGKIIREPEQLVFQDDTAPLEDERHRLIEKW